MDIRKELYARRAQLTQAEVIAKSKCICDALQSYIKPGMVIASYAALPWEVSLSSLQQQWQDVCTWALPISGAQGDMKFYQVKASTCYKKGRYGIQEPWQMPLVMPEQFDLIFIPMVGFDEAKHRLGHGAGYYDRWLKQTHAIKIGVAFELQKVDHIDVQPHDVDMDIILSEKHIYR